MECHIHFIRAGVLDIYTFFACRPSVVEEVFFCSDQNYQNVHHPEFRHGGSDLYFFKLLIINSLPENDSEALEFRVGSLERGG